MASRNYNKLLQFIINCNWSAPITCLLIFWSARLVFRHDGPTLLYDGLLHLDHSQLDLFLQHILSQQCLLILNDCLPPFLEVVGVQRFFNPIGPFWLIEDIIHLGEVVERLVGTSYPLSSALDIVNLISWKKVFISLSSFSVACICFSWFQNLL